MFVDQCYLLNPNSFLMKLITLLIFTPRRRKTVATPLTFSDCTVGFCQNVLPAGKVICIAKCVAVLSLSVLLTEWLEVPFELVLISARLTDFFNGKLHFVLISVFSYLNVSCDNSEL
jgi:hypothetical protein